MELDVLVVWEASVFGLCRQTRQMDAGVCLTGLSVVVCLGKQSKFMGRRSASCKRFGEGAESLWANFVDHDGSEFVLVYHYN